MLSVLALQLTFAASVALSPSPSPACPITVAPGDTLSALAPRYGTTWQDLAAINHLANANLIFPGQVFCLGGETPLTVTVSPPSIPTGHRTGYNPGAPGSCVWYVFDQRPDLVGLPGYPYASQFALAASQAGYRTGTTPVVGAVAVFGAGVDGASSVGHVAIVEAVNNDGTFRIREMNGPAGPWAVDTRDVPLTWGITFVY